MKYLELYSRYITITSPKNGNKFTPIKCPFHEESGEKKAGVNLFSGNFNCFKCGSLSPTKFVSKFTNVDISQAEVIVDIYRKEKDIKSNDDNFSKKFIHVNESQEFRQLYLKSKERSLTEVEWAREYAESKGFDLQTLINADVGFLYSNDVTNENWNKGDVLTFPYFYGGKVVGLRYRTQDGSKSGPPGCVMVPWGLDNVSEDESYLIITEGESDRLKLIYELSVRNLNFPVISLPGNNIKEEWGRDFTGFSKVILIPDSDNAGTSLTEQAKSIFEDVLTVIDLPWGRRQLGKDFCEWASQNDCTPLINEIQAVFTESKKAGKVLTFADFIHIDKDEHEDTFVSRFIHRGQLVAVGGGEKSKKTQLMLNLVRALLSPGSYVWNIPDLVTGKIPPKILFIETEGSRLKFVDRLNRLFDGAPNLDNFHLWWKPGIKINTDQGYAMLKQKVMDLRPDILIADPFQELFVGDEDKAKEVGPFWSNIIDLNTRFNLTSIVSHHFGKDASISDRWKGFRGSSSLAGKADVGIFTEKRPVKEGYGIKVAFEFRDEAPLETIDGNTIFKFEFDDTTGKLYHDSETVSTDKSENLVKEMETKKRWLYKDAVAFFGVSETAINNWIKKYPDKLRKTKPSLGNPVYIEYIG